MQQLFCVQKACRAPCNITTHKLENKILIKCFHTSTRLGEQKSLVHASHGIGSRHVVLGICFYPGIRIASVSGYGTCSMLKMTIKDKQYPMLLLVLQCSHDTRSILCNIDIMHPDPNLCCLLIGYSQRAIILEVFQAVIAFFVYFFHNQVLFSLLSYIE